MASSSLQALPLAWGGCSGRLRAPHRVVVLVAWEEPGAWSFATKGREITGAVCLQCHLAPCHGGFGDPPPAPGPPPSSRQGDRSATWLPGSKSAFAFKTPPWSSWAAPSPCASPWLFGDVSEEGAATRVVPAQK